MFILVFKGPALELNFLGLSYVSYHLVASSISQNTFNLLGTFCLCNKATIMLRQGYS